MEGVLTAQSSSVGGATPGKGAKVTQKLYESVLVGLAFAVAPVVCVVLMVVLAIAYSGMRQLIDAGLQRLGVRDTETSDFIAASVAVCGFLGVFGGVVYFFY